MELISAILGVSAAIIFVIVSLVALGIGLGLAVKVATWILDF